jgi:ABC-type lipoprotein release transport system permease subunit
MKSGNAVVVSEHLALQLWPGQNSVGQTLRIGNEQRPVEVIGVSADIKHRSMNESAGAYLYRPLGDSEWSESVTMIVRVEDDPRAVLGAVQEQARAVDRNMPVVVTTMTERMKLPLWPVRTAAGFFLICGVLALILATVGLFGVLYYTVTQRTREFGIRTALGATSRRLTAGVLGEGLRLAVPGIVLGVFSAYVAARFLSRGLFGIGAGDPLSFAATVTLQMLVTLAASALPAYRATRSDPMLALRQE